MKFVLNTIISALIIATVAELGKKSTYASSLLIALPITSILALSFLYVESKEVAKVTALSYGIFWLVLPTLLFFLLLPVLLKAGVNFWAALAASSGALVLVFVGYAWALRKLGIEI